MEISPLYHNIRPEGELLPQEAAAFGILEALGIDYDRVSSDPADTMEKCAAVSEVLGVPICKNLFLCNRQKTDFYLLLMDGEKPFHTKDLSKQIGTSRLSFAPPELMEELLNVTPGSATILALMNDKDHRVKLVLDQSVAGDDTLSCHPCISTSSIILSMEEVRTRLLPHLGVEPILVDLPDDRTE